jgi:hypothetical protein
MPTLKLPPLNLTPAEWENMAHPERMLMIAAQLCDVEHVQEEPIGSNRGPWVDQFLLDAHTDVGQPWCAAFVAYCLVQAGGVMHVLEPAAVLSWVGLSPRRRFLAP